MTRHIKREDSTASGSRERLEAHHQLLRVNELLSRVIKEQPFYAKHLSQAKLPLKSLDQLRELPLLNKDDLLPGIPVSICGLPRERYVRAHQTSGTTYTRCWCSILKTIGNGGSILGSMYWMQLQSREAMSPSLAFSYGPFMASGRLS